MTSDLEEFLKQLGHPGRYQCFICVLLFFNIVPLAFNNLNMVFLGVTPPHHCKVSSEFSINETIPLISKAGSLQPDQCHKFINPNNHVEGLSACNDGWIYDYDDGEWGIVGEWDLVCERKGLLSLVTTLYFGGTLIGAPIFGLLTDRFGRKPLMMIGLMGHILCGCLQFLSSSFVMFAALKIIHGVMLQGMILASSNLNFEMFGTAHRTEMAIAGNTVWTTSQFILVFFAFFVPKWRWFFLATTLPSLFAISYFWLVPESLRWLLVMNRTSKAIILAQRFVRLNKIEWTKETLENDIIAVADGIQRIEKKKQEQKIYNVRDLFRTPGIRKTSFITLFCWFCTTLIYYGISFILPSLAGSKYVNFVIGVCVELASRIALYFVIKKFGRRLPTSVSFVLAGLLCIVSAVTKSSLAESSNLSWLTVGCALLGKAMISLGTACCNLLTLELFPTVIRGLSMGLCGLIMRVGAMIAPQILLLGDYTSHLLPFLVFGISSVVAGLLILLLPETRDVSLPDTIEEAEALHSKNKTEYKGNKEQNEECMQTELEKKDGRLDHWNQNVGSANQEGNVNMAFSNEN